MDEEVSHRDHREKNLWLLREIKSFPQRTQRKSRRGHREKHSVASEGN